MLCTLVILVGIVNYFVISNELLAMDVFDDGMWLNRDWDPCYLAELFHEDFNDMSDLWISNITDTEMVNESNNAERYCPIIEDISLDDSELCTAVEKIEQE